jgi:hypothetical protein
VPGQNAKPALASLAEALPSEGGTDARAMGHHMELYSSPEEAVTLPGEIDDILTTAQTGFFRPPTLNGDHHREIRRLHHHGIHPPRCREPR